MKKHLLLLAVLCLPGLALLLLPEQAHAADEDFVSRLVHEFYSKALSECGRIFRYAIATGRAERDIAADLRGGVDSQNL